MGIHKKVILTLRCDDLYDFFKCPQKEVIFIGRNIKEVKKNAEKAGWIIKTTKCICPSCVKNRQNNEK